MVVINQQLYSFDGKQRRLYIDVMNTNLPTLAERLKFARTAKGLSQKALGGLVGVSQAAIQKIETGKARETTKLIELSVALEVRPEWLASGDGAIHLGGNNSTGLEAETTHDNFYRVDVLDLTVSAGPGKYLLSDMVEVLHAIEFTSEYARSLFGNRPEESIKVMTVDGDSMHPTVSSGDRLFFDVSVREFFTDGVYAFFFGKTFHVKRLQMQGLKLAVLSDNPSYKDWFVTEAEQDQLYIMGKALIHESIKYNKL